MALYIVSSVSSVCFIPLVRDSQVPLFCDSIFLCITLTKRTLLRSKQSEPYVKAYKFLLKSVRFIRAKIFILDLSEKPYPSTGRLSCLLILLFQHKHINIHIRTLEILYV